MPRTRSDTSTASGRVLAPGESEHALGQGGPAFGSLDGVVDERLDLSSSGAACAGIEIAEHHRQQVVEVVPRRP